MQIWHALPATHETQWRVLNLSPEIPHGDLMTRKTRLNLRD
ncbi:hypothetical protein [uncultured Campylobacter sp.]|nr:hypothetical protein [uncultured Campylobacter sp.]